MPSGSGSRRVRVGWFEGGINWVVAAIQDAEIIHTLENAYSREELREFANAANSVREQEKSRVARELHDELSEAGSVDAA